MVKYLKKNKPLTEIFYNDRYLRSPMVLRLLREFLRPLSEYPGGINNDTRITINTSHLAPNNLRDCRLLFHDWRNANDRKDVLKNVLAIKSSPQVIEKRNYEMPHARELRLTWDDGTTYKMRFDQGMGYWHVDRHSDASFPFDKQTDIQSRHLLNLKIDIHASSRDYPTHWYIGEEK